MNILLSIGVNLWLQLILNRFSLEYLFFQTIDQDTLRPRSWDFVIHFPLTGQIYLQAPLFSCLFAKVNSITLLQIFLDCLCFPYWHVVMCSPFLLSLSVCLLCSVTQLTMSMVRFTAWPNLPDSLSHDLFLPRIMP